MKRFFSLFFIVAILCLAMVMVSCGKEEADVAVPEIDNPTSEEHHVHKLEEPQEVKPTCISGGYNEHKCSDSECGYVFRDNFTSHDKSVHKFGAYVETVTPTCQVAKVEERTCSLCGLVEVKNGSVVAHNFSELVENVPYTCFEDGHKTEKCQWCDETKTTVFKASHTFTEWNVDVPNVDAFGNCVIGLESRDCTVCEHHEEREIKPHTFETKVVKPTCVEMGYEKHVCTNCEFIYFDNYKPATGKHNYGAWVDYDDYVGYEAHYCDTCGHAEYRPKQGQ